MRHDWVTFRIERKRWSGRNGEWLLVIVSTLSIHNDPSFLSFQFLFFVLESTLDLVFLRERAPCVISFNAHARDVMAAECVFFWKRLLSHWCTHTSLLMASPVHPLTKRSPSTLLSIKFFRLLEIKLAEFCGRRDAAPIVCHWRSRCEMH